MLNGMFFAGGCLHYPRLLRLLLFLLGRGISRSRKKSPEVTCDFENSWGQRFSCFYVFDVSN